MRNRAIHTISLVLLMAGAVTTAKAQSFPEGADQPKSTIKILGNVYGGGEMASVGGNTEVEINQGQFAGEIFGGGEGKLYTVAGGGHQAGDVQASADVAGNTELTIKGGEIIFVNGRENNHNIYGGGNLASNIGGNTTVDMQTGMVTWYTFLSNQAATIPAWYTWYDQAMNPNTQKTPIIAVFGAGYGAHTDVAGNTNVTINIPGDADIHPAGTSFTHEELESIDQIIMRWMPDHRLVGQFVSAVHGGGYDGTVGAYDSSTSGINYDKTTYTSQTNVTIKGQPFIFHVYGGGLGSKTGADANGGVESHVGAVYGAAKVDIQGGIINGDVFGGGAGIAGQAVIDNPFPGAMGGATVNLPYTYAAQVMRETDVTISGNNTVIFGNVYGGGDIANTGWHTTGARPTMAGHVEQVNTSLAKLDYTTSLNLIGGNILGNVYGGGNGRKKAEVEQYKFVGSVIGSTNVTVDGSRIWGNIYGGGNTGCIYTCETIAGTQGGHGRTMAVGVMDGSTNVSIQSGLVARDIFGGGYGDDPEGHEDAISSADIYGNAFVHFAQADLEFEHYWQPREIATSETMGSWGNPTGEVTGRFLPQNSDAEHRNTESDITHNLYGGGNMACTIYGNTHVYMSGAPTVPAGFNTTDYYNDCIANVAKPHFSAFGGGYGQFAQVIGNAYSDINLSEGSGLHSIVGGGMNGPVGGSCQLHVGNHPNSLVHHVYGGGYYAPCGSTELEITRGTFLEEVFGGAVMGNINEGGNATDIATRTVIGLKNAGAHSAVTLEDEHGNTLRQYTYAAHRNQIRILGNVYGGNDVSGTVNGIASLTIYGGTIEGDVFGAGNGDHIGYYVPGELKYDLGAYNSNYFFIDHRSPGMAGNTYVGRPQTTGGVELTLEGNTQSERVSVLGQVFGGGNSCTVGAWNQTLLTSTYASNPHLTRDDPNYFLGGGKIDVRLGSHITIGRTHAQLATDPDGENYLSDDENVSGLFMGCSGRHLATQNTSKTDNFYHHYFDTHTGKYWPGFAVYTDDGTTPLTRAEGLRSFNAYMNNILVWSDEVTLTIPNDAEDIWLANFVGGGFRGSMKAQTAAGKFDYTLPEGVTIGHAVVGGAYNTDVVYRIFATEDGHTYTEQDGHYQYLTDADGLQVVDNDHPNGDYHHIEYAEDGVTPTGIARFYYDGGMLAEDGGNRAHRVHADPRANAAEYATAYFEPMPEDSTDPAKENAETRSKLFTANKNKVLLHLDLRCAMEPEVTEADPIAGTPKHVNGGNVYGGCYMSGLVQGDSWVDYSAWLSPNCTDTYYFDKQNNMHIYDEAADLERNNAMTVYGAGYGEKTHTDGDVYLYIKAVEQSAGGDGDRNGKFPYMFNAFGGSNMGTVNGNTNVYYAAGKQGTLLGSLYGGGYKGDISGNTFVELAEGFVTNVYGGSRQANIGGAAHVWAYDGKGRGIDDANHLIICNLYGGNDIAGTIGGTMPASFTASKWNDLTGVGFNTYVEVSADDNSANRGFPLIGSAYAGGNGLHWEETLGTKPDVATALLEMDGGSTLRAFGGGNKATITGATYIFSNARSTQFAEVTFSEYQKGIMQHVFFSGVPTGYSWSGNTLSMDPYHVVKLYGGNNVADMDIQPTWYLKQGKLGSVYSGGNLGNMTYYNPSGTPATQGALNLTPKGLCINVSSDDVEINELYGGCRMADVQAKDAEGNPITFTNANDYGATVNVSGGRINNVYGGNDIAGHVHNGTNVNITGAISGDVYGSGNGNYVYQHDATTGAPEAGVMEERVHGDLSNGGYIYYAFRGATGLNEQQRIRAINAIRPNVDKAYLNIAGSESNLVYVKGNVFCGGNASTVSGAGSYTKFDIGSYCVLNGVYMGSNGEQMADNDMLAHLREVNGFYFNSSTLLKEYMDAVTMAALPREFSLSDDLTEAYIGTFCLGGNRGSMTTNQPVHMTIPASVTIYNKVVGGCNNTYLNYNGYSTTGGFTTWNTDKTQPKITLDIYAKFVPWKMTVPERGDANFESAKSQKFLFSPVVSNMLDDKYCNVYGGCYTRGYVYGDVVINMYSDMVDGFDKTVLQNNITYNETNGRPVFSVFGGGYGANTVVYGNTHIRLLNNHNTISAPASAPYRDAPSPAPLLHPSANAIYGGGEQGKMIGTATIHIADGTVYSNVVGGALNGSIYGNTEILVGYPNYWEVQKTGEYKLKRSNFTAAELAKLDGSGDPAVRQSIFLIKGDRINAAVYQAIRDWDTEKGTSQATEANLKQTNNKVSKNWDDIVINIKGGIYGGGYARENVEDGQTAMANTVLKFTNAYNLATAHPEYWTSDATLAGSAIAQADQYAYGGNSNIWVQDAVNATNFTTFNEGEMKEHITISTETDPVAHTGKGGIFGDGHSSLVAAFRSAAVEGYGYAQHPANNPKLLNTFQRFDVLQIRDCSMKMYGDIDVATGQNDPTYYAVSRITELMLNSHIDADAGNLKATSQLNARNVIDFYNPVHFLGSITSEVTFKPGVAGSRYHNANGEIVSDKSYYDYKSELVAKNYDYSRKGISIDVGCKELFGTRNVGTAKNLIRINDPEGRGVHLKVVQENNYAVNSLGVREEQSFYGPLSGVFEFELTHANARGGGYVYSNNLHQQTITQSGAKYPNKTPTDESFLQTSGNVFFVPVYIAEQDKYRQVYDDCYPIPYSSHEGELDKAHYWFVEGNGPTWCSYPQKPTMVDEENKIITINIGEELAWVYDYIDHGYDSGKATSDPEHYHSDYDIYPEGFAGWTLQLGNDIDLNQLTILDQREVRMIWCPIADQKGTAFKGTFDGNGHKIDGMLLDVDFISRLSNYGIHENYADGYDHYFGLFAKTDGAVIKNVELSDAIVKNLNGNNGEEVHIGTLITQVNGTTVQDCSVQQTDTITTNMTNAVAAAAAFICHTAGSASTIVRNFVSGSIDAYDAAATNLTAPISGFISTLGNGSTMEHCYSLVDVHARQVAGLADTVKGGARLEHAYYAGTLTRENTTTPWGAILANADNANVKHCYYDVTKNPSAGGYRGGDTQVFKQDAGYTSWSTFGLSTADMTSAADYAVWRSCYSHGHTSSGETHPCELDAADGHTEAKASAWNKGTWTYIPGFYPFLKAQEIDCSALTTAFQMPTAESLGLTTQTGKGEQGWYFIDKHFQLPTYGNMYWTVANNTLLLDSVSKKATNQVDAHLYLGGPDALTLNCDEYVRWMRDIYVIREDINSPEDSTWYAGLSTNAKTAIKNQLHAESFTLGMLRNKEVTNTSKKTDGIYPENGFDGDLHIWNREGSNGSVTNQRQYTVNGTITYYTGYRNPYIWHEVNLPFEVDHVSVYRRNSEDEYNIVARNAALAENQDGGNFWLRSFDPLAEIPQGGHFFQQAWIDPATSENYGHRPSVLRFPKVMKVEGQNYLAGDYWCYDRDNTLDGTDYHNGGSEIRFYSTTGNTIYGTIDWEGYEDHRGGSGFKAYGNPTLGKITVEGYYWLLESEKRDTTGVHDEEVIPEINTTIAQWFSIQQDPVVAPLGIWVDGPEDFKEQALGEGAAPIMMLSPMHEPGVAEQFGKKDASFTVTTFDGMIAVFSYVDQVINIYDSTGRLTYTKPVRANTGFTVSLPKALYVTCGTNSAKQVKVLL